MKVAVVGAGPAGVRAVEQLVRAGLTPTWIDEAPDGGGRIYQRPPAGFRRDARALYGFEAKPATALHAALDSLKISHAAKCQGPAARAGAPSSRAKRC